MKKITLLIVLLFFAAVNSSYYWEGNLGVGAMLADIVLFILFIVLLAVLFYQLYLLLVHGFEDRQRNILVVILLLVLGCAILKPHGIVNFESFEGNDVLIARQEGAANCSRTLKLKDTRKFSDVEVCFGVTKITGTYKIKNDTLFLFSDEKEDYVFAVIKHQNQDHRDLSQLYLYKTKKDTVPRVLDIQKNEVLK